MNRIVVTGIGAVSPLGCGIDHIWPNIISGKSGIVSTDVLGNSLQNRTKSRVIGIVPLGSGPGEFDISDPLIDKKGMGKFTKLALIAAREALHDANWIDLSEEQKLYTGVSIGNGFGALDMVEDKSIGISRLDPGLLGLATIGPFFIPAALPSLASGYVSIAFGLKGPNRSLNAACASGLYSIEDAAAMIRNGDAKLVVTGSTESTISIVGLAGFDAMTALSRKYNENPATASRPYDKGRDGFVLSEGAGILVIEDLEHAKSRGAKIYAEYISCGMTSDAYHVSAPSGAGSARAMEIALTKAGLKPDDIGYIGTHATSTILGDASEIQSIKNVFGEHVYDNSKIKLSALKSSIGHLLGGASGFEAAILMKSISEQILTPTINVFDPDECIAGIDYVPHPNTRHNFEYALKNSFGFGGTNASTIFKRYIG